jgi:hypothetical protein
MALTVKLPELNAAVDAAPQSPKTDKGMAGVPIQRPGTGQACSKAAWRGPRGPSRAERR